MAAAQGAQAAPAWRELRPGMEFAFLQAESSARVGSARIALLRVDPKRYLFRVLSAGSGEEELSADQWRAQSGALAVFNAGQYAEDHSYLGLLIKDGRASGHLASRLEALFLADPSDSMQPAARVLDLRYAAFDLRSNPYRQAAQSLMLLDRFGQIRVRRSPKVAHRTAVAEDDQGRIIVMVTEGAHTLWELAAFLAQSDLGLREVMLMDGGAEAQLDLEVDGFKYETYGGPSPTPDLPWPRRSLPAALAILPRK